MSDYEFDDDALDASALGELDLIEQAYASGQALPPRSIVNKPGLVQRDLFGGTVQHKDPPQPRAGPSRANTAGSAGGGGGPGETKAKVRLSKRWDPASFAKHGWSKKNAAAAKAKAKGKSGKGKQRAYASDEEAWDDEDVLDEDEDSDDDAEPFLVDTTYDPHAPIPPIKWPPDPEAIKTFIYPVQRDKQLRNYQFNIVQRALYDNTLVSLPTGLGKTFIAAVIMLNFYRWYPRGKVLFLAPTRPLVSQQIKACHYIAGIPQSDCIELTGSTLPKLRSVGWATKRVIYSTPQTVERDLAKGRLDPRDVTCIVVDEAHRASGDYSYCGVIRYIMSRNPHFRVLALTATPGSRGDAVQEVIDNLHIGRIEVRADDSLDIRQYIHKKSFDLCVLPLGPQLGALRDKWADLMRKYIQPLYAAKLLWSQDAVMLAPYAVQMAYGKIKSLPGGSGANGKFFPMIKTLQQMARAMEYLVIQSVTSFESVLKDIEYSNSKSKLVHEPGFRDVLRDVSALRARKGYVGHPKMEKLRSMCLEHFKAAQDEVDEWTGERRETRVMIFCNFRAVVEEIVECLNTQRPLIKATPFVGQASSKGVKGKSQKEQLETIKKFKAGVFNVLVATSIGEEGLDIGEIDLIVCYEANKSPIRMLQRVGRTGRARDGHIIVLMSEGREEKNWDKANDAYQEVQNALTSNKIFDLYVDGERLLPDDVKPRCEQVEIKALPLDLNGMTMNGQSRLERAALAEKKPKRKVDVGLNAPQDAFMGFRTAGALAHAAKAKPPPPSQVLRERKADALLTVDEEAHLRTRWQQDGLGRPIRPARLMDDLEALPFRPSSTQRITHHSERYADAIKAIRLCDQLADDKPAALDAWHEKSSAAFNPKLVQLFRAEDRVGEPPKHVRLRRLPPSSPVKDEEDGEGGGGGGGFPATFPMTGFAPLGARSSELLLDGGVGRKRDDDPLFLFSQPSQPLPSPPARRRSPSPVPPFSPTLEALPAPRPPPPQPKPPSSSKNSEVLDLSLADSDSDEVEVVPPTKPTPSAPPSRPPSRPLSAAARPPQQQQQQPDASFDLDDGFDLDLVLSDSELLQGAQIRGKSASKSPPKQPKKAEKEVKEEIVLDDSEDETPAPAPFRPVPRPSAPSAPFRTTSTVSASTAAKPGFRPFVAPRPSASNPSSQTHPGPPPPAACKPAPAPNKQPSRPASPPSTDEYSMFDLPSEELDACFAVPQAAVRGALPARSKEQQHQADDDDEDMLIMPPPPVASSSKPKQRWNGRVPDSSDQPSPAPSAATKPAFRPASALVAEPEKEQQQEERKKPAPMRRMAIADSSSPVVGAGNPRLRAPPPPPPASEGDVPLDPTQEPKQLNRLRRGRQASPEQDGDLPASSPPPPKKPKKDSSKDKKKKKGKKPILTHKQAAKFGIFDVEAVNSSASGSEASSEDYDSENSVDRDFVAGADETFEDASPERMAAFYRESLATQAPGVFGTPGFGRNGAQRWQGAARRAVPITPGSMESQPDDWSYGSFVVGSDEEIEMEESSPAS
ncbi:hypothetical protein JCM8097_007744 [Rhodosporidiobolus ruineniae]